MFYKLLFTPLLKEEKKKWWCFFIFTKQFFDYFSLKYLPITIGNDIEIISIKLKLKNKTKP